MLGSMIANTASTQEATTKYYSNRDSTAVWNAGVACIGLIAVGASLAEHSLKLTSCLLLGAVAVWYLGYWALSKSCYFLSPTKAGFKDAFRAREVQFEEIRSATKAAGRQSTSLIFVCNTRTVTLPLDPIDESWFLAVKTELLKRGIPVSSTAFGFPVKKE
jgi:hypothetical protein